MIGNNMLSLCPAEMMRAVQLYLDTVMFREGYRADVSAIRVGDGVFEVFLKEAEKRPAKPDPRKESLPHVAM